MYLKSTTLVIAAGAALFTLACSNELEASPEDQAQAQTQAASCSVDDTGSVSGCSDSTYCALSYRVSDRDPTGYMSPLMKSPQAVGSCVSKSVLGDFVIKSIRSAYPELAQTPMSANVSTSVTVVPAGTDCLPFNSTSDARKNVSFVSDAAGDVCTVDHGELRGFTTARPGVRAVDEAHLVTVEAGAFPGLKDLPLRFRVPTPFNAFGATADLKAGASRDSTEVAVGLASRTWIALHFVDQSAIGGRFDYKYDLLFPKNLYVGRDGRIGCPTPASSARISAEFQAAFPGTVFRVEGPGVFLKVAGTDRVKDYGKFLPWAKEHGYLVGDDTGGGSGDDLSRCR